MSFGSDGQRKRDLVHSELKERILVGELTHYPTAGNKSFDPPEWDVRLGALWPRGRSDRAVATPQPREQM